MRPFAVYEGDVVDEVLAVSARRRDAGGLAPGIPAEHVIVDPGIGFGKTAEHNLRILSRLDRLVGLGFPDAAGNARASRRSES